MVSSRHPRPLGARQNHGIWHRPHHNQGEDQSTAIWLRIGYMSSNSRANIGPNSPRSRFHFQPPLYLAPVCSTFHKSSAELVKIDENVIIVSVFVSINRRQATISSNYRSRQPQLILKQQGI
ncbi:hypothetical protein DAPPUDRAFT_99797 [Daphnia pulex]|uniref:Uncharacterized protein n=1 Tax=Daphnia pulex TaxID=6669 RepID=E9G8B5_DAPPU|nr:hypothetical protein DAPPUDRAFT_99797 [Daphnia pulex]|eukprot:EFX84303.1 hypothetical protein DAPPUDRAFT_99797 [Daphnia pulex]